VSDTKFKKGQKRGPGRPPGTPNKVTREFRETVKLLLEANSENVGIWLAQVAEGHGDVKPAPEKALDLLAKLAEFAAPKQARMEHVGEGGGPVEHSVTLNIIGVPSGR
jgi:hypothetical protein